MEEPSYGEIVWGQFRKRRLALASLWAVACLFVVATVAPLVASNMPFFWRVDEGAWSSPWLLSLFDRNFFESALDVFFNTLLLPGCLLVMPVVWVWRATRRSPRGERRRRRGRIVAIATALWLASLGVALAFSGSSVKRIYPQWQAQLQAQGHHVVAVYPPLRYSFRDVDLDHVRAGPSFVHPLGTDNAGRDVLTRLIYGTRVSLTIGIFAVLLYVTLGTIIGALAGYYGGWADVIILRAIEVMMSIPSLFLVLTMAAFIEQRSIFHIMAIIAAVSWTTPARLVRAEFLRLRHLDFVIAARACGFSPRSIIFREMLPSAMGPVLVTATFGVAAAILVESTMSFLGLGDITVPSWGQILNAGRTTGMWTLILAPGAAIFLTVSLLNLVGEGLRDALDPTLRQ